MGKQVRLTDLAIALIEAEMFPRESYSDTLERLLKELGRFRQRVRILDSLDTFGGLGNES